MKTWEKKRYSLRGKMIGVNFVTTLVALLLCGGVFTVSVWAIMGEYINKDLNFFLSETADNVKSKLEYCEDVIYQLRDNETLMSDLRENADLSDDELVASFQKEMNISGQSNIGAGSVPLVEEIYLFNQSGDSIRSSYYAMMYTEEEENNQLAQHYYQVFLQDRVLNKEKDYCYYREAGGKIYLAFVLCDENMNEVGVLLYKLREDALNILLQDLNGYENSFWVICDKEENFVTGKNGEAFMKQSHEILQTFRYKPYKETINQKEYRLFRKELCMNLEIVLGIPENQAMELMYDSVKIYMLLIAIITVGACIIFFGIIYYLTKPIKEITDKLKAVKEGAFETKLPEYDSMEFYEISKVFNDMTTYVNHLIKQVYEKQISIKEMELKFLQTQMNPHFMFNVLNTIALQAKMDQNEEVYKMISSFSQLTQAKIYRSDTEKVKIKQELEYVDYYLYLQSYRFGERLDYDIEVESDRLSDYYIPKLCIQLIVENAVVHGLEPKVDRGMVKVHIYETEEGISIDTIDNGIGFTEDGDIKLPITTNGNDKAHNHVGLNNAHHIIQLIYGEQYGIFIQSKSGVGTTVSIRIPFDQGNV